MPRVLRLGFWMAVVLIALPVSSRASFPVTASNINQGTVMPQSPAWPFPQFLEYGSGRSLALNNPDGVPHAEMEAQVTQSYIEAMRRLQVVTGWVPSGLPNRLLFTGNPSGSEANGYALLMSAFMADKDTFDGLWIHLHSFIPGVSSYDSSPVTIQQPNYAGICQVPGMTGWMNAPGNSSETDGDEDICLALLVAWKQWGDVSGYLTASGTPISYRQAFLDYASAMTSWQAESTGTGYDAGDIGIDGYPKTGNVGGDVTNWATTAHPPTYPTAGPYCGSSSMGYTSYLAPGWYRCFANVLDSTGNTQQASQFHRAAASSEYILEAMNAQRPPYSIGTESYTVNNAGLVSFSGTTWGSSPDGIRTPYRTGLSYLWFGDPADRWDPANCAVRTGANTATQTFVNDYASLFYDPRVAGNPPFNENYGLTFWGFPQWRSSGWTQAGSITNGTYGNYQPVMIGPMACAAVGATGSLASANQHELLMNCYRQLFMVWDKATGTGLQANAPAYYDSFFRWMGLAAITGNLNNPSQMVAKPNLKVYESVDKTVASPGETLTYVLSYRNYGASAALNVLVQDVLPSNLLYVASNPPASMAPAVGGSGTVAWSIGTLSGLNNTAGGGTNKSSTMGSVTLMVKVDTASGSQRICNPVGIYAGAALQWTSNEYPNEVSMTYRRNCVDVVPGNNQVTVTAAPQTVTVGQPVTFTLAVTQTGDSSLFLNGGRPKVYPGFSASVTSLGYGPMMFYSQLRSESYEPLIDPSNYRWSFYFYDPLYGYGGSSINQSPYIISATHNPNTYGSNANRTLSDFSVPPLANFTGVDSMVQMPIPPGQDANGRWNQRYVFRWFDTVVPASAGVSTFLYPGNKAGFPSLWYGQKYASNTGLNMQYGDMDMNVPVMEFYVSPAADQMRPTSLWANGGADRAWSYQAGAGPMGSSPNDYPLPVSPDWTAGTGAVCLSAFSILMPHRWGRITSM